MEKLSNHFKGIAAKELSPVETQLFRSHQHEFNGTKVMKQYLGMERRIFPAHFLYLTDEDEDRLSLDDEVTWYDARESHPTRSEHRLYFRDNEVMDNAVAGDILLFALDNQDRLLLIVIPRECQLLASLLWIFGIPSIPGTTFESADTDQSIESTALFNYIADEADIEVETASGDRWIDLLLEHFGEQFPKTRCLSDLARQTLKGQINPVDDPDYALMALMDREEEMFRQLERHIVSKHLERYASSWSRDVDSFVKFSLSVQNRRKSRAGHALENHLQWTLEAGHLKFDRGAITEGHSKPDFLFPGAVSYHDKSFPSERLAMLGVKTTCKDRWRQVLNEAHRIPHKHLLTLQPAISQNQLEEMKLANLSLVLPKMLHATYASGQRSDLLSLREFMHQIASRQV